MADDEQDTPVDSPRLGRVGTRRRLQSATERDIESDRARKERDMMTASGEVIDVAPDEITGRYEGDELKMYRGKRPTDQRFEHLEEKHDRLDEKHERLDDRLDKVHAQLSEHIKSVATSVSQVSSSVAEIRGEMKVIPELVSVLKDTAARKDEREKITLTATVGVDTARAMEPIEAKRARRAWVTSLVAIVATLTAGVLAIIQARGC